MMKYYVHVPFCHSKCAYCDFYSMPSGGRREMQEAFVTAVGSEIDLRLGGIRPFDTLYFGGGTPSSLPSDLLGRLTGYFLNDSSSADVREFTIEVNPEDVTCVFVSFLRSLPVLPRVSMGVQSFDNRELAFIGRRHTADDAVRAYELLRGGGIENISMDLIYGLPGQDFQSWKRSLDRMIELRPDHLSAYLLSYESGTRLWAMLSGGKVEEAPESLVSEMYSYLCSASRSAGYHHYEISNFCLPGREAVHNSAYWTGEDYVGLGPGAHSYCGGMRGYNRPSLKEYLSTDGCGVYETEEEDSLSRFNDVIITSLRTSRGFDPKVLDGFPVAASEARRLISRGMLSYTSDGFLVIPEELWLRSDAIMRDLILV